MSFKVTPLTLKAPLPEMVTLEPPAPDPPPILAIFAFAILSTVTPEVALPVWIVTSPPVLKPALLLPVFASELMLLSISAVLYWVRATVDVLLTVAPFCDNAPLPEMVTSVS